MTIKGPHKRGTSPRRQVAGYTAITHREEVQLMVADERGKVVELDMSPDDARESARRLRDSLVVDFGTRRAAPALTGSEARDG